MNISGVIPDLCILCEVYAKVENTWKRPFPLRKEPF